MVWARFWGNRYSHGDNGNINWHNLLKGQFGKRSITMKIPFNSEIPLQTFLFYPHTHTWTQQCVAEDIHCSIA